MKLVGRERLDLFTKKHPDARAWIGAWVADAELASWKTSHDIKAQYATASFLPKKMVIFNVKGNDYRMETTVAYTTAVVVVTWIGTHSAYDQRNKNR